MPNGVFTDEMLAVLAPYVAKRVVHDLGAGAGKQAEVLERLGAIVEQVDQNDLRQSRSRGRYHEVRFKRYCPDTIDVAFISWPTNSYETTNELLPLLRRANTIIYLGKNTDATQCGTPALFQYLTSRISIVYVPDRRNVLIIYGEPLGRQRSLDEMWQEEMAGLMANENSPIIFYSDS